MKNERRLADNFRRTGKGRRANMQDAETGQNATSQNATSQDEAPLGQGDEAKREAGLDQPSAAKSRRKGRSVRPRRHRRHRARLGLFTIFFLLLLGLGFFYLTLAYTGKSVRLPTLAVAEVESRLNAGLVGARLPPGSGVVLDSVEFSVDSDFVPKFRLTDLRLIDKDGRSLLTLPEAVVSFDPMAVLSGRIRPSSLRLSGTRLGVRRDAEGNFDLSFAGFQSPGAGPQTLGEIRARIETILAAPIFERLKIIEAEDLALTLTDDRAKRSWQIGDGKLLITLEETSVSAELGLSLLDGATLAKAELHLTSARSGGDATFDAKIDTIAARDLAAMAPPLAWLAALDAPISGKLSAVISEAGAVSGLKADLALAKGSLSPKEGARPIDFDSAELSLSYDTARAKLKLDVLTVESASLRLRASGEADLLAADAKPLVPGELPKALLGQIEFSEVMIDPAGQFVEPVRFSQGALDLRLRLQPFKFEIGQLSLVEGDERLLLSGDVSATPEGWDGALDMRLNQIEAERLLKVWPMSLVPKTRLWFQDNVGQAHLYNVQGALRLAPGSQPKLTLGYEFADTEVKLVRTLPPVLNARGHAVLEGKTYTVVVNQGHVLAPEGGRIEVDGTVAQIRDITERPMLARIEIQSVSSLTATLSLLDQEPFSFFSKAGQPYNLGDGRAELHSTLLLPIKRVIPLEEVEFNVSGKIVDFASPALVAGRLLTAPEVKVAVDTDGLALSGVGKLDDMPIDLTYVQGFGPEQKGKARINGTVTLSDPILREFGVALPEGSVSGEGPAAIDIALVQDLPPQLTLISTLSGLGLRLDALGWTKPAKTKGSLDLEARLDREPVVERMTLTAPGLSVEGRITTLEGGGLGKAEFSSVKADDWLDAPVVLTGDGSGGAPAVAVTGGSLDLRKMPDGSGGAGAGGNIKLALDKMRVSDGIALTDFRGDFGVNGGFNGSFTANVNGGAEIVGVVAPSEKGSAVRITSDNAGGAMASAGVFDKGRGGTLDLTLTPLGPDGEYKGKATFEKLRVQGAPALAELLSAMSIVGLLEQMDGAGLAFSNGEASFVMTPKAVEISKGSAVGASLGISFAGLYLFGSGAMDVQGVISPIYLVNGVGQIFSKKGEGLFGFNYRLTGTVDDPVVSVNPLSVFTPGMFREIFREAPPNLKDVQE